MKIILTPRQKQVVNYVTRGLTNREIADKLGISRRTVEVHRAIVMGKYNVHNVAQLLNCIYRERQTLIG